MPTYTIVARGKDPLGPNEINAGQTISVNDGDVFVIDPSADGQITFDSASGTPTDFSVEVNGSNSNNFGIRFEQDLRPDMTIADDADLSDVRIDARDADEMTLNAGDNVSLRSYQGSEQGSDTLTVGDNFAAKTVDTNGGDDAITAGSNAAIQNFRTDEGDDSINFGSGADLENFNSGDGRNDISFGDNAEIRNFRTGDGDDTIDIGDGADLRNFNTGAGDDAVTIGDDGEIRNFHTGQGNDTIAVGDDGRIRNFNGGPGDDDITFGDDFEGRNINAGAGDDTVRVGKDADITNLNGGSGDDTLLTQTPGLTGNSFETTTVICFARGTHIETDRGEVRVEDLARGDLVRTVDHGLQPIRWIGSMTVAGTGRLAPVEFAPGALGNHRALRVSPQHRMLLRGWRAELFVGQGEVLAPAKQLVNASTIRRREMEEVEYFHILFDCHQIVIAEGAESESFHPGAEGMDSLAWGVREEIYELFPALRRDLGSYGDAARPSVIRHEARLLAQDP